MKHDPRNYDGHSGELTALEDDFWRRQLGLPPVDHHQRPPSRPRKSTFPPHIWQQVPSNGRPTGMSYIAACGLIEMIQQRYSERWCVHPDPVGWDPRTYAVLIWPVTGEWRVFMPSVEMFRLYDARRVRLDGGEPPVPGGVA